MLKRQNGSLMPSPGFSEEDEIKNTANYKQKYYKEHCL